MEEYSAEQLVAVNLAGFFDLAEGSNWRESVNAPNPLYTVVSVDGTDLDLSCLKSVSHTQKLDIKKCYKEAIAVVGIALWATLGNLMYSSEDHDFTRSERYENVVKEIGKVLCEA